MRTPIEPDQMTDDQRECYALLVRVYRGAHHLPRAIYAAGRGLRCNVYSGLATFDFDQLTRLVVLAHDACIRVELQNSAPHRIALVLHKRHTRTGSSTERHPTIEEAIARIRGPLS